MLTVELYHEPNLVVLRHLRFRSDSFSQIQKNFGVMVSIVALLTAA